MALILVTVFLFFSLVTGNNVFYPVGGILQAFLLGAMGYFSFPLLIVLFFVGLILLIGKLKPSKRGALLSFFLFMCMFGGFAIVHLALSPVQNGQSLYDYVKDAFGAGSGGYSTSTAGGALFASLDHLLVQGLTAAGTFVVWSLVVVLCAFAVFRFAPIVASRGNDKEDEKVTEKPVKRSGTKEKSAYDDVSREDDEEFKTVERDYRRGRQSYDEPARKEKVYGLASGKKKTLVVGNSDFEMKRDDVTSDGYENVSYRGNVSSGKTSQRGDKSQLYSDEYNKDFESKLRYVKSGRNVDSDAYPDKEKTSQPYDKRKSSFTAVDGVDDSGISGDIYMPNSFKAAVSKHAAKKTSDYKNGDIETEMEELNSEVSDDVLSDAKEIDFDVPFDDEIKNDYSDFEDYGRREEVAPRKTDSIKPEKTEEVRRADTTSEKKSGNAGKTSGEEKEHNPFDEMPFNFKYNAPPLDLLKSYSSQENYADVEFFKRDKATKIINTLKVLGGVEVSLANIVHGPTVTRFDISIPDNVSIKTVLKYADDLKLRLETKNDIRITPIPGASLIGVEVANEQRSIVGLKEVIESDVFQKTKKTALTFAIGKDIVGNPVVADLTKTLHMLIAGASGTGKSVGLNSLLISWFYKYSPADLRLIIVDPKLVEFKVFEGIPHLLFGDIITDAKTAVAMLNWAVKEMEARYAKMAELVVHNIDEYNDLIDPRKTRKLPKIVIIIDEFADLMSTDKKTIEEKIGRLAQKARAAGMYLILATQRPSVNIIEGSIKTNFISRMAFKMSNATDSATIIGEGGAEKLLGNGDLLYRMSYMANMERAQGAYIDMDEIKAVVNYIRDNNECYFNEAAMKEIDNEANPQIESVTGGDEKVPDYYIEALKIAVETGTISISLIQRRLKSCGFPKAAKIYDWMVAKGYVLNSQGGKQKQVTLSPEEFNELYGDYDV